MRSKSADNDYARLVYSSEVGRVGKPEGRKVGGSEVRKGGGLEGRKGGDGVARVRRESKGRGGKTVTVIDGLLLDDAAIKALAGELKRRCGTGGTVKDGVIEIQGDHRELLLAELAARGLRAKAAGG